jgi:hypothetical protein
MGEKRKGVREQWSAGVLKLAKSAVKSALPSRRHTSWRVSRDRSPVKKPTRNALWPVNTEKQLQERVLCLQEVGFGLTWNNVRRCC